MNYQSLETIFTSLMLYNRVVDHENRVNESRLVQTSDFSENRTKTGLACIFISSQLFEVIPISPGSLICSRNKKERQAITNLAEKITTETL